MRCSVSHCTNDSRTQNKSENGITFHVFPKDATLRERWLTAISRSEWRPTPNSAVCSEHFLPTDVYLTQRGMRKIKPGAVPFISHHCDGDQKMPKFEHNYMNAKVCKICLAMGKKLYSLKKCKLSEIYKELAGTYDDLNEDVLKKVCIECANFLNKINKFKQKVKRTQTIIKLLMESNMLTEDSIKSIDRENQNLKPNLKCQHFEPNYYDISIDVSENDERDDKKFLVSPLDDASFNGIKNEFYDQRDDGEDFSTVETQVILEKVKRVKSINKKRKKVTKNIDLLLKDSVEIIPLTYEEQVSEILLRKETANYKNAHFKCDNCYKGFADEHAYRNHTLKHEPISGEYQCDICKVRFKNRVNLRKHISSLHNVKFCCKNCPVVSRGRQQARTHERWHRGTQYQCPHCEDFFTKQSTHTNHIRRMHPCDFVCEVCGYSFVSSLGLTQHKNLKHREDIYNMESDDNRPHCGVCDVRFHTQDAYKRHLFTAAKHNVDTSSKSGKVHGLSADEVPKASKNKASPGPINCEQCNMVLETAREYHNHFRRAHKDKNRTLYPTMATPYMCETCGKVFTSGALLKEHSYRHTGERPFRCNKCSKSFTSKARLSAHQLSHTQDKPYMCNTCHRRFSVQSNLKRHMLIHTGVKAHACDCCDKKFKTSAEKIAHTQYVHLHKPWPKRRRHASRHASTHPDTHDNTQQEKNMIYYDGSMN